MTERSASTTKMYKTCLAILADRERYPAVDLRNPEAVYKMLVDGNDKMKPKTPGTVKNYLSAIRSTITDPAVAELYSKKIKAISDETVKVAEEQKVTEKEKGKYMEWTEIVKAVDRIQADPTVDDEKKLLLLFYTQMPPVRADYANLTLYGRAPTAKKEKGNYIIHLKKTSKIVINEHKTAKTHGPITQDLPFRLHKALDDYLEKHKVKVLFPSTEKRLSEMVIRTMRKQTGKDAGINIFRHSYISELRKDEIPLAKKKAAAAVMGHGVGTQELYRRVD